MALPLIRHPRRAPTILLHLARGLLALVAFAAPTFFLPGMNDAVELPKAALLLVAVLIAGVAWGAVALIEGQLRFRPVVGGWFLLGLAVVVVVSTAVSVGHVSSLLGTIGHVHHALPIVLTLLLAAFLAAQVYERPHDVRLLTWSLLAGLGLAAVISVPQVGGASILPWSELRDPTFFVTGSSSTGLAVLLATLLTLLLGNITTPRRLLWRMVIGGTAGLAVLLLLAIDAPAGWIALLVGAVVATSFISLRALNRAQLAACGMAVLLGVAGLLLPTGSLFGQRLAPDARLDATTAWQVTQSTLARYPIVGSGPTTFYDDFVRFHPASYNSSPLASLRFGRASDEGLELLATTGILGVAALLGFIVTLIVAALRRSDELARREGKRWGEVAGPIGAWIGLVAAGLFAPTNAAMVMTFWMLSGLLLVVLGPDRPGRSLSGPTVRAFGTLALSVGVAFLAVGSVWSARLLLADRGYVTTIRAIRSVEPIEQVVARTDRLARLNPTSPLPYLLRAQAVVVQAELARQNGDQATFERLLGTVLRDAETAASRDPNNPAVYESLAELYKSLGNVAGGSSRLVIDAYERAVRTESASAKLQVDLGQAAYLSAAALREADPQAKDDGSVLALVSKARAAFDRALELQPGDFDASFGLVLVDEMAGESDRALERLADLARTQSNSSGLWYQLGLRYAGRKDTESARAAFERAVALDDSFTDAHWRLALLAEGRKDVATERRELETVLRLDSTRSQAQAKLDRLPKP